MTTISKEMIKTTVAKCPTCNKMAKNDEITESCKLAYSKEIEAVNVCVRKARFLIFAPQWIRQRKWDSSLTKTFG